MYDNLHALFFSFLAHGKWEGSGAGKDRFIEEKNWSDLISWQYILPPSSASTTGPATSEKLID